MPEVRRKEGRAQGVWSGRDEFEKKGVQLSTFSNRFYNDRHILYNYSAKITRMNGGNMFHEKLKHHLVDERLSVRIILAVVLYFTFFITLTVLSYYLLPEKVLLGKNSLTDFETSTNLFTSTVQIFSFNLLSVVFIVIGNLFAFFNRDDGFIPSGYLALGLQCATNAITLGTWSFTAASIAPDLPGRLLRVFDLAHRAGLWEMMGQVLVLCATARIAIIKTNGNETVTTPITDIRLKKSEIACAVSGLCLMFVGAFVESSSILSL
jgi:hypothetical protein